MTDTDDARKLDTLTYPHEAMVQMRQRAERAEAEAAALRAAVEAINMHLEDGDFTRAMLLSKDIVAALKEAGRG